jgi:hypothetical protein
LEVNEVGLSDWRLLFNFCKGLALPAKYNCKVGTVAALIDMSTNQTVCHPIADTNATISGSINLRDYNNYNVSESIKRYDPIYGRLQLRYDQKQACPFEVSNKTSSMNI